MSRPGEADLSRVSDETRDALERARRLVAPEHFRRKHNEHFAGWATGLLRRRAARLWHEEQAAAPPTTSGGERP